MKKTIVMTLVLAFVLAIASTAFAGTFVDVPTDSWAYPAIQQLIKDGIIQGYDDGTFRGNKALSRYEMAIVVAKAIERADKADAVNKELINKLAVEFAQELKNLGIRVTTLETKVNDLEKIKFDGDFRLQNRTIHNEINSPDGYKNGSWDQLRIRLNFSDQIDDNTTLFARFSDRNDFGWQDTADNSWYGDNSVMDQYGVKFTDGNWTIKAGRQDAKLGQGAIIGVGNDAPGIESKLDGVTATLKNGDTSFHFLAGKEQGYNQASGTQVGFDYLGMSEWYGLDVSTKLSTNLTAGLAFASEKYDGNNRTGSYLVPWGPYPLTGYLPVINYGAVNVSYNLSPTVNFYGEYAQSNYSKDNKAYDVGFYFTLPKGYVGVQYNDVQKTSVDPYVSGIGDQYFMYWGNGCELGYKCAEVYFGYPLTKTATFELVYNNITSPSFSGVDKEFVTDVIWRF
jgi:hypothetical protein